MKPMTKRQMIALAAMLAGSVAWPQQPFDLDPSFRTLIRSVNVNDLLIRDDGNIIISGTIRFNGEDLPAQPHYGALLNSSGGRVNGFPELSYLGGKLTPWQDQFYGFNGMVSRHFMDGSLDTSFEGVYIPAEYSVLQGGDYHVFPDGRVLITGLFRYPDTSSNLYSLLWLDNTGRVDTTRTQRQADNVIWTVQQLPDGKFMCWGGVTEYDGNAVSQIFRIEADGALDTGFQAPSMDQSWAYAFYPTPGGKVVAGGFFHIVDAPDTVNLIRLLPDGQLDPSFNPHTDYNATYTSSQQFYYSSVLCILPLGADRLFVTGGFNEVQGEERGGIALLDTAGHLVSEYFTGSGCGEFYDETFQGLASTVAKIKPAPDGGYYICGAYHGYNDGTTNDTLQRFVSRLYGLNVGVSEQEAGRPAPLQIAPNPSTGPTQFAVDAVPTNALLMIHDASGRRVWQEAWPAGGFTYNLPAGTLAPGTYLVQVHAGTGAGYSGRLVVLP